MTEEQRLQKAYDDYIEAHNAEFSWLPLLTYEEFKREIETEE